MRDSYYSDASEKHGLPMKFLEFPHRHMFHIEVRVSMKPVSYTHLDVYKRQEEEFYKACEAAAILGTFQAAYTDFPVLTNTSKKIAERDALRCV